MFLRLVTLCGWKARMHSKTTQKLIQACMRLIFSPAGPKDGEREMRGFPCFLPDPAARTFLAAPLVGELTAAAAIFICLIFVPLSN